MRWPRICARRAPSRSSPSLAELAPPGRPGSLAGRCIAVTRPAGQCAALAAELAVRGASALVVPLIAIEPIRDSEQIRAVRARLGDYQLAFFVSPNAVHCGLAALAPDGGWPASLRVATVGRGSARALRAKGFEGVIAPEQGADSEAVLALPEFSAQRLGGCELLIVRGEGGRELLGEQAAARGARVSHVSCYRRRPPADRAAALFEAIEGGRLDALTLTSSEALRNLVALATPGQLARLGECPVFASHPRIAAAARAAGLARTLVCAPGDDGLLAALDAHFGRLG